MFLLVKVQQDKNLSFLRPIHEVRGGVKVTGPQIAYISGGYIIRV